MTAPWWLTDGLAASMVVIAAYCAIRPVAARRWRRCTERDVDAAHVLMGVAMAATLVPRLDPIRNDVWAVALAAAGGWFAVRAARDRRRRLGRQASFFRPASAGRAPDTGTGHHLIHLLSCGSMLYMLLAASSAGVAASAMSAAQVGPATAPLAAADPFGISALIALVLAVAMAGAVVRTTDRLAVLAPARAGQSPAAAPTQRADRADRSIAADGTQRRAVLCPRLAASCRIAMGVTMVYMLVQML
jgi:hypothetical protein